MGRRVNPSPAEQLPSVATGGRCRQTVSLATRHGSAQGMNSGWSFQFHQLVGHVKIVMLLLES